MATISEKRDAGRLNTAADIIARISNDPTLPTATRQKWCAGIRGLVRGARTSSAQLPADAAKFAKAMSTRNASHHHAKVSPSDVAAYWHGWRSAARHCGLVTGYARNTAPRSTPGTPSLGVCRKDRGKPHPLRRGDVPARR